MPQDDDVIFALSSGQGKSGVAVVRVSGKNLDFLPAPQTPRFAKLVDFHGVDNLIAIYFKAPNSFTGEDVVELHCHGGTAVIGAVFDKLRSFGFRMAERGEFSRRAFQNGKMDLTEVEGMRALIDARTERQCRRALQSLAGSESDVYMKWRSDMIELAALAAARMDYDADDLPKDVDARIKDGVKSLADKIRAALASRAKIIESGFNVVLAGETNVGKSSLFNRLLGENRAIVSDIAGTTRDVVSAELDIDGYLVRLLDTAGLRESADGIEKIGIERTNAELERADLIVRVVDRESVIRGSWFVGCENEIVVINKSDLISANEPRTTNHESRVNPTQELLTRYARKPTLSRPLKGAGAGSAAPRSRLRGNDKANHESRLYVSAKTGEGVADLLNAIKEKMHAMLDGAESDLAVSGRAKEHLENAALELEKSAGLEPDLQSERISNAAGEIGLILGIIGTEEIYDSVFGQLCLGK